MPGVTTAQRRRLATAFLRDAPIGGLYVNEPRQTQTQTQSVVIDDEAIIDVKSAANFLGYVSRSMKRRRRLMVTTASITFVLVFLLTMVMPRSYVISMHILTHKAQMMQALVDPGRSVPPSADTPIAGAVELIKSRENLENLMEDVKLQQICDAKRGKFSKMKDDFFTKIFGGASQADMHEAYLKMLQEKITPSIDGDIVVMEVEWSDPDIAMALAEGAIARFLKMRHDMELSEILETVNILGRAVESSRVSIEEVVKRMQKVFDEKEADLAVRSGQMTREQAKRTHVKKNRFIAIRKPASAAQVDEASTSATGDLKKEIGEKQAVLTQIKKGYDTRVKKAQEELANLRASLGPDHPDVAEAKRALDNMQTPPAEVEALQAEVTRLSGEMQAAPAAPSAAKDRPKVEIQPEAAPEQGAYDVMRVQVSEDLYKELDKDPEIAQILGELKKDQDTHEELVHRLAAARIESETANVAFEYRYKLTSPPVYPKSPVKPKVPVMLGGGAVAALILGIIFAVVADVMSKRILEAWQIERFLRLKVLGEVEEP